MRAQIWASKTNRIPLRILDAFFLHAADQNDSWIWLALYSLFHSVDLGFKDTKMAIRMSFLLTCCVREFARPQELSFAVAFTFSSLLFSSLLFALSGFEILRDPWRPLEFLRLLLLLLLLRLFSPSFSFQIRSSCFWRFASRAGKPTDRINSKCQDSYSSNGFALLLCACALAKKSLVLVLGVRGENSAFL